MNWTRSMLKQNAKLMVRKNYLLCVVVTFLVTLFAGSAGGRFNINYNFNADEVEQLGNNLATQVSGDWVHYALMIAPFLAGLAALLAIAGILFKIFVGNALRVGGCRFYLHNIHSRGDMGDLGFAFQNCFGNVVKTMLLRDISIFLWSFVFVIPGIIKAYQYTLVPYLLAENPELSTSEALRTSKEMMAGEKLNTFVLELSFILWDFLSTITGGLVGIAWVNPYKEATMAELYTAIKARFVGEVG